MADPQILWKGSLAPVGSSIAKQVAMGANGQAAALFWVGGSDGPQCAMVSADAKGGRQTVALKDDVDRLICRGQDWLVLDMKGSLYPGKQTL